MMKTLLGAGALVLALVALLTWLLLHSIGPDGSDYVFAQRDVARVSLAEAALLRDVLQARAGLLRNYDPLVGDIDDLRGSAEELSRQAMVRDSDRGLLDRLLGTVAQDEVALERFKTDNALLQNAISYFDALDSRLGATDPGLATAIASLGNSVLHLTRNSSEPVQQIVRQRLDGVARLADRVADPALRGQVKMLVVHGRMLSHLLPTVDRDMQALFSVSTYDLRQAIRGSQDARRMAEEVRADGFRLALFASTLLLSLVLVRIGLHWRNSLRLLRQRARLETVIADISARFLVCPLDRFEAMIDTMLERLGPMFGADRGYLILSDPSQNLHAWRAAGPAMPSRGQPAILASALAAAKGADDLVEVPQVAALPGGDLRDQLTASGAVSWCGIILRYGAGRTGLLAFDRSTRRTGWPDGGAGMVRMAGEVVSGALQRRQTTLQRLEFEERLSRVRRMEALGTFASGIAHNFNNVIGAVLGYAEMAGDSLQPGTTTARHVQEIHRAGERARELVGHILDFGTRSGPVCHDLRVDEMLAEAVSMMRASLSGDVTLSIQPGAPDVVVSGDAVQLQQVLLNLIRNAAQATAPGGQIRVSSHFESNPAPRKLLHDTLRPGDYACLRVSDTGEGMDHAVLASVFQPFFTTRPAGTGLGLATVREIVQDHDGAIDVFSTLHQGSLFTVWLPAERQRQAATTVSGQGGDGQTVLLIGYDASTILHDEETLAALGYEPVGFHGFAEALANCRQTPGRFDIILIDLSVIKAEGSSSLARLRDLVPQCPIVVLAWNLEELDAPDLASLGVRDIIRRPLRSIQVAGVLAACCTAGA